MSIKKRVNWKALFKMNDKEKNKRLCNNKSKIDNDALYYSFQMHADKKNKCF